MENRFCPIMSSREYQPDGSSFAFSQPGQVDYVECLKELCRWWTGEYTDGGGDCAIVVMARKGVV